MKPKPNSPLPPTTSSQAEALKHMADVFQPLLPNDDMPPTDAPCLRVEGPKPESEQKSTTEEQPPSITYQEATKPKSRRNKPSTPPSPKQPRPPPPPPISKRVSERQKQRRDRKRLEANICAQIDDLPEPEPMPDLIPSRRDPNDDDTASTTSNEFTATTEQVCR